ncbi:MAG: PEP-CTERM sorting domain-containing protein [Armatimonadetes bacterium]|nr:PEP-CTERM sorting domain-containing protein [Armatimonadota bacterium]
MNIRTLSAIAVLGAAALNAHAVTFSNVVLGSGSLMAGSSYTTLGNSISFMTPNAIVGDGMAAAGTAGMQYDADAGSGLKVDKVWANVSAPVAGSGAVAFTELVFELDSMGNEVGGPIGTLTHTIDVTNQPFYSAWISLSKQVQNIRVKKSFTLAAPDVANQFDYASVAVINQSVVSTVPEPATLSVLALGAVAALRRRNK